MVQSSKFHYRFLSSKSRIWPRRGDLVWCCRRLSKLPPDFNQGNVHRCLIVCTFVLASQLDLRIQMEFSLHMYTCAIDPSIHHYVDSGNNCEDIAMNMLVSSLNSVPPVYVHSEELVDFGTLQGLSFNSPSFTARREHCLTGLIKLFHGKRSP